MLIEKARFGGIQQPVLATIGTLMLAEDAVCALTGG